MPLKTKRATRLPAQTLLVLLLLFSAADASALERGETLRRCREQFGAAVDEERNLFEVNEWYVLEVKFDPRSRLSELNVVPKHFFEESRPEWEEPESPTPEGYRARYLTRYDYEKLLQRLDRVAPKGRLLKRGVGAVVTNMTSPVQDYYERAELTRGEVPGVYAPTLFRYVRLRYLPRAELTKLARRGGRLSKGVNMRAMTEPFRKAQARDRRR